MLLFWCTITQIVLISVWLLVFIYMAVSPMDPPSISLSVHFRFTTSLSTSAPEGPFQEITHYHPSLWRGRVGAFITPIRTRHQHMISSPISGGRGGCGGVQSAATAKPLHASVNSRHTFTYKPQTANLPPLLGLLLPLVEHDSHESRLIEQASSFALSPPHPPPLHNQFWEVSCFRHRFRWRDIQRCVRLCGADWVS